MPASDTDKIKDYDLAILTSTWGMGDLQDDWFDPLDKLKQWILLENSFHRSRRSRRIWRYFC